jgi:hypothetical protein
MYETPMPISQSRVNDEKPKKLGKVIAIVFT